MQPMKGLEMHLRNFFLVMGGRGWGVLCVSFSLCNNVILLLTIMNFLSIFA